MKYCIFICIVCICFFGISCADEGMSTVDGGSEAADETAEAVDDLDLSAAAVDIAFSADYDAVRFTFAEGDYDYAEAYYCGTGDISEANCDSVSFHHIDGSDEIFALDEAYFDDIGVLDAFKEGIEYHFRFKYVRDSEDGDNPHALWSDIYSAYIPHNDLGIAVTPHYFNVKYIGKQYEEQDRRADMLFNKIRHTEPSINDLYLQATVEYKDRETWLYMYREVEYNGETYRIYENTQGEHVPSAGFDRARCEDDNDGNFITLIQSVREYNDASDDNDGETSDAFMDGGYDDSSSDGLSNGGDSSPMHDDAWGHYSLSGGYGGGGDSSDTEDDSLPDEIYDSDVYDEVINACEFPDTSYTTGIYVHSDHLWSDDDSKFVSKSTEHDSRLACTYSKDVPYFTFTDSVMNDAKNRGFGGADDNTIAVFGEQFGVVSIETGDVTNGDRAHSDGVYGIDFNFNANPQHVDSVQVDAAYSMPKSGLVFGAFTYTCREYYRLRDFTSKWSDEVEMEFGEDTYFDDSDYLPTITTRYTRITYSYNALDALAFEKQPSSAFSLPLSIPRYGTIPTVDGNTARYHFKIYDFVHANDDISIIHDRLSTMQSRLFVDTFPVTLISEQNNMRSFNYKYTAPDFTRTME